MPRCFCLVNCAGINQIPAQFILLLKQNFPSIIPLPKKKDIIFNIEQLLSEARREKFGDPNTGWTVLESEGGMKKLIPSPTKENVEVKEEPIESDFNTVEEIINKSAETTTEEQQ